LTCAALHAIAENMNRESEEIELLLEESSKELGDQNREKIRVLLHRALEEKGERNCNSKERPYLFLIALFLLAIALFQCGSFLFLSEELKAIKSEIVAKPQQ
jgi:hypothetical protein